MSKRPALVIFKLGSLGDMVMSLPLFHRIAELHPGSRRILLTNFPVAAAAAPAEAVLRGSGLIDDFVSYPIGLRSPVKLLALKSRLLAFDADRLFYLQECLSGYRAARDALYFRFCGFSEIVGVPDAPELRRHIVKQADGLREAECERLARCLKAISPIDLEAGQNWDLMLSAEEREFGRTAIDSLAGRPKIAINMGGKAVQNDWGRANWNALIVRLARRYQGYGLFVVGSPQDDARAAEVGAVWNGPFVNACGKLSPRQSAAALECATLFVGHDSGPLHLAASRGVPCVGLYGNLNPPGIWHPYYGRHRIIQDMRGVTHIPVEAVEVAIDALLGATSTPVRLPVAAELA